MFKIELRILVIRNIFPPDNCSFAYYCRLGQLVGFGLGQYQPHLTLQGVMLRKRDIFMKLYVLFESLESDKYNLPKHVNMIPNCIKF